MPDFGCLEFKCWFILVRWPLPTIESLVRVAWCNPPTLTPRRIKDQDLYSLLHTKLRPRPSLMQLWKMAFHRWSMINPLKMMIFCSKALDYQSASHPFRDPPCHCTSVSNGSSSSSWQICVWTWDSPQSLASFKRETVSDTYHMHISVHICAHMCLWWSCVHIYIYIYIYLLTCTYNVCICDMCVCVL